VGPDLILETTFLVDLERELARSEAGPAQAFLERHPGSGLHVTFTIAGELAAGSPQTGKADWERLISPFRVLPWTPAVSWRYGQLHRYLSDQGLLIGTNDLWIAATAIAHELPIVTANDRHFRRVPGLDVRNYR
jgi:predicted nucleic acid-binding protein